MFSQHDFLSFRGNIVSQAFFLFAILSETVYRYDVIQCMWSVNVTEVPNTHVFARELRPKLSSLKKRPLS